MRRPMAYITAAWGMNEFEDTETAAKYCRKIYEAGFTPMCPLLFLPLYLDDEIPQVECYHKSTVKNARK